MRISQIQINIIFAALLLILLIHAFFCMNRKSNINKVFMWVMGFTSFMLISESMDILLNNPDMKQYIFLHKLINVTGFIIAPAIPYLGSLFLREWINRYQNKKTVLKHYIMIPLVVNTVASLLSLRYNIMFYLTEKSIYTRGPYFMILPIVSCLYLLYNLYIILKNYKRFSGSEYLFFLGLFSLPLFFISIQLEHSYLLTIWNSCAFIFIILYVIILNDQAYRDGLSGLKNRLAYEHYIQTVSSKKLNRIFFIYIDIDDFKEINDEYGHNEGDEALKVFSSFLLKSFTFRKKKIMRIGGDEFLVIAEGQTKETLESNLYDLQMKLQNYNKTGDKKYQIKFSFGMSGGENGEEDIRKLLEEADSRMYENKKIRKSCSLEKEAVVATRDAG